MNAVLLNINIRRTAHKLVESFSSKGEVISDIKEICITNEVLDVMIEMRKNEG